MTMRVLIVGLVVFGALVRPAAGDDVRLKARATASATTTEITLADIATLDGAYVETLAATAVGTFASAEATTLEITVADVRAALTRAGVHWGKVNLRGRTVTISRIIARAEDVGAMRGRALDGDETSPATKTPVTAARPVTLPAPDRDATVVAATVLDEPTVRGAVARLLVRALERDAADVRFRVRARDAARLDEPFDATRDVLIASGSTRAARISFRLRRAGVAAPSLNVHPEVRTTRLVVRGDVPRGHELRPSDVQATETWAAPIVADAFARADAAASTKARRQIENTGFIACSGPQKESNDGFGVHDPAFLNHLPHFCTREPTRFDAFVVHRCCLAGGEIGGAVDGHLLGAEAGAGIERAELLPLAGAVACLFLEFAAGGS